MPRNPFKKHEPSMSAEQALGVVIGKEAQELMERLAPSAEKKEDEGIRITTDLGVESNPFKDVRQAIKNVEELATKSERLGSEAREDLLMLALEARIKYGASYTGAHERMRESIKNSPMKVFETRFDRLLKLYDVLPKDSAELEDARDALQFEVETEDTPEQQLQYGIRQQVAMLSKGEIGLQEANSKVWKIINMQGDPGRKGSPRSFAAYAFKEAGYPDKAEIFRRENESEVLELLEEGPVREIAEEEAVLGTKTQLDFGEVDVAINIAQRIENPSYRIFALCEVVVKLALNPRGPEDEAKALELFFLADAEFKTGIPATSVVAEAEALLAASVAIGDEKSTLVYKKHANSLHGALKTLYEHGEYKLAHDLVDTDDSVPWDDLATYFYKKGNEEALAALYESESRKNSVGWLASERHLVTLLKEKGKSFAHVAESFDKRLALSDSVTASANRYVMRIEAAVWNGEDAGSIFEEFDDLSDKAVQEFALRIYNPRYAHALAVDGRFKESLDLTQSQSLSFESVKDNARNYLLGVLHKAGIHLRA